MELENLSTVPRALAEDGKPFAGFFDGHGLKRFQILFDLGPFQALYGLLQAPVPLLLQHQRQETAKHIAPDNAVPLVEDRTGEQKRFFNPKHPLHLP